jgi:pimeloyl-ACP methyl ester carboxylesterase
MSTSKLLPFHDPRITLKSANLNGRTYGYIFMPRAANTPNNGTIVLIHGFPDLAFGWRYQIPFLSSLGLDVIAPDSLGYGRTDSPAHGLEPFTYKRIANDIATLCTQLGLSRIILGGHDWGGAIVYRIALYHPQLIRAVFAICTPYNPPVPTYTPLAIQVATKLPNFGYQLVFASGVLEENCNTPLGIRQFLMNMYGARTSKGEFAFSAEGGPILAKQQQITTPSKIISEEELDYYVQEYSRHGLRGPLNWYRTQEDNFVDEYAFFFKNGKETDKRVKVEQETLFVLAKKDQALKEWMAEKMEQRVPKLTRRSVDAGHWCLWEKPEEMNGIIGDWLKEKVFGKEGGRESKL